MSNPDSPYVGPRPFMKGDENIFYGRDTEAQALMSLIVSHSAVLLYSQSGAGKTSLLNAKVRQLLEAREVEVLGSSRVGGSLPPDVDPAAIENIFVYFALTSLEGEKRSKQLCTGNTTLTEYLKTLARRTRADGGPVQRVIFFDQFEEIFTTSQQRWGDRPGFFEQVGLALETDPHLRVVFAMREEYLASLDVHVSNLPERLRTRFHLERLRYEPALEAVTKPLEGTDRKFADGVAEQLVRNLLRVPVRSESGFEEITGEFVEPVQLQVVCQNIWNSLPENVKEIDDKFVASYGDVDVALINYYENCLRQVIDKHTIKEAQLRRWFDKELLTADGLRGIVYQGDTTTGSLPNNVVSTLEDLRLVRAEPRGGALWYELTHDRFIAPIHKSNQTWFAAQRGGLAKALETKVSEYRDDPRDENLIRGSELKNALKWLETAKAEGSEVSDPVRTYILDSKNAVAKRRARTLRRQVAGLVLLLLGALFAAGWSYREKRRADHARYDERVQVANAMIGLKKYQDALVWGLKSAEPSLTQGSAPSPESINSLRSALKAVGGSIWSRTLSSASRIAVSSDGGVVFTFDSKGLALWKAADGTTLFAQQFDKEKNNLAAGQKKGDESAPDRSGIESASFSPAGNYLIVRRGLLPDKEPRLRADLFGRIYQTELWDTRNNLRVLFRDREAPFYQFADDDSRMLIFNEEKVRVIEVPANKTIFSRDGKSDLTLLSPSGQQLVQIINGTLIFRNLSQAESKINQTALPGSFKRYSATFSDDGKKLVIFQWKENDRSLTLWDTESGKKIGESTIDPVKVRWSYVKFLSGNTAVLLLTEDPFESETSDTQIWDVSNNTHTKITEKLDPVSTDGRSWHLVRTDKTSRTILRDPRDQNTWIEFTALPENVTWFVPSKQLNAAATLSKDNVLQYWLPGNYSEEIDKLSPAELYHAACNKLRYQEKEFQQVSALCQPLLK